MPVEQEWILMACPTCGHIAESPKSETRYCIHCRIPNVNHRVMTVPELLRFSVLAHKTGHEHEGNLSQGAAVNLIRYATIVECLRAAGDAYAEASYAGVDAHGSYDSAMGALQELLEAMQDDPSS